MSTQTAGMRESCTYTSTDCDAGRTVPNADRAFYPGCLRTQRPKLEVTFSLVMPPLVPLPAYGFTFSPYRQL